MTKLNVLVRVFSRPERYSGEETGRTQWVCEPVRSGPFAAVLGRDYTREDAIADWKRRASHESYAKNYEVTLEIQ